MTRDEYMSAVQRVLDSHTLAAIDKLKATLARVPANAKQLTIEIFMDQDGEGFLDVRVNLQGPDLYVLNKAIEADAELFSTSMGDDGLDPALPLMEPGGESFSVHDALSDVAAQWIERVWHQARPGSFSLPAEIATHDDYGSLTPIRLNR